LWFNHSAVEKYALAWKIMAFVIHATNPGFARAVLVASLADVSFATVTLNAAMESVTVRQGRAMYPQMTQASVSTSIVWVAASFARLILSADLETARSV
jgi:hypothetical protein